MTTSSRPFEVVADGWEVSGPMQEMPLEKRFTPLTFLLFRGTLVLFGWWPAFSHWLKGRIRKALILRSKEVPIRFHRKLTLEGTKMKIGDEIQVEGGPPVTECSIGSEFATPREVVTITSPPHRSLPSRLLAPAWR